MIAVDKKRVIKLSLALTAYYYATSFLISSLVESMGRKSLAADAVIIGVIYCLLAYLYASRNRGLTELVSAVSLSIVFNHLALILESYFFQLRGHKQFGDAWILALFASAFFWWLLASLTIVVAYRISWIATRRE
jgi:hypothetical protein